MTRHPDGTLTQEAKKDLRKLMWKWIGVALSFAALFVLGSIALQLKTYGTNFVSQVPTVIEAQKAVAIAQTTAQEAKTTALFTADELKSDIAETTQKIDSLSQNVSQLLTVVRATNAGQQSILIAAASTNQHLVDLEKQVDRLEARQTGTAK